MSGRRFFDWVGRQRAVMSAALLGALAVSLVVMLARSPEPPRVLVQQTAMRPAASPQVASLLVVHLSGEVVAPGVYRLPVGARIDDALKAAGGPTGEGDIHRLNLAARLADGQQIVVPRRIDPVLASRTHVSSPVPGRMNLNTAGVAELDQLPGVGPVTAQRIVAYREQHGPFQTIDELAEVSGISDRMVDELRDLITTGT